MDVLTLSKFLINAHNHLRFPNGSPTVFVTLVSIVLLSFFMHCVWFPWVGKRPLISFHPIDQVISQREQLSVYFTGHYIILMMFLLYAVKT